MKQKSKKPKKQRKRMSEKNHTRFGRNLSAHLSMELMQTHRTRSLPVRTGDRVKVMRGDYKGYEGRVARVKRKEQRIFIDGINREKADGTSILVPVHPSNVEIVRLEMVDKWRKEIIERRGVELAKNLKTDISSLNDKLNLEGEE